MRIRPVLPYLFTMVAITMICGFVYLEEQQSLRQLANDPQIQIVEDVAAGLVHGKSPALGLDTIEISTSLAPFLMLFDSNGVLNRSNAVLDGRAPTLPKGVFDWVKVNGEDRISWRPRGGVRCALIVVMVKSPDGGFVACGRSLRETEARIELAGQRARIAWVMLMIIGCGGFFVYNRLKK